MQRIGKQQEVALLFPSAVLTASGSKGISQHNGTPKVFVNVKNKIWECKKLHSGGQVLDKAGHFFLRLTIDYQYAYL